MLYVGLVKRLTTSCPQNPDFAVAFASFHGVNTFTVAKAQTVSMTPLNRVGNKRS